MEGVSVGEDKSTVKRDRSKKKKNSPVFTVNLVGIVSR